MSARRSTRRRRRLPPWVPPWDEAVGRLATIIGFGLLGWAIVGDRFRNPALLPAAVGLILARNVYGKK